MTWAIRAVLAAALLLGGCAGDQDPGPQPTSQPSATRSQDPTAALVERCASMIPEGSPVRQLTLPGQGGLALNAAVWQAGRPGTAMVLLHQTGPAGLCGWGRFATAAARRGITSVALDMCGYGDTRCPDDIAPAAEVRPALDYAREQLDARRVVLVGTSMGGSSTVIAVADGAEVDGWVDVSGPSAWGNVVLEDLVGRLHEPGMVVYARSDGPAQYAAARQLARRADARFVDGGNGHGYELMTDYTGRLLPAGRVVVDFVRGNPG